MSPNYAWLTFLVLSPATPFHVPCSRHLSTPWLSCHPVPYLWNTIPPLSICQNSAHLSRHSSNITSELPPYLSSFYLSTPEYSLLPLNSHSALSLYHSTRYILLCLSSLLDSGFFIFIFTTSYTVPGMNSWNRGKRRDYKGHVLPFHVQYDSQWDDKQPSIPTNYPNDPKGGKISYC